MAGRSKTVWHRTYTPATKSGQVCTVYFFAKAHGLPVSRAYLTELARTTARRAGYTGLEPLPVQEGPFTVDGWPESVIFAAAKRIPAAP